MTEAAKKHGGARSHRKTGFGNLKHLSGGGGGKRIRGSRECAKKKSSGSTYKK